MQKLFAPPHETALNTPVVPAARLGVVCVAQLAAATGALTSIPHATIATTNAARFMVPPQVRR
jgi:hypothetical protein